VLIQGYAFLWPLSARRIGWGIMTVPGGYKADLYGIANAGVLTYGLIFLAAAIIIRTLYERKNWVREIIAL
jgi:hypothetical protein